MTTYKVGYFVGSLAKASINRKLSKALVNVAPSGLDMVEIPFKDLPLYSYDYDADYPPVARAFKQAIADVDAVLFVTPEYNRSIPGALKNAIDWASRPWGKNSFTRKPSAIIGTSPGSIGTAVAQQSLRSVLCFCNSPLMNTPRGLRPVHAEPDHRRRSGLQRFDRRVPAQLHGRIPRFHRAGRAGLSRECVSRTTGESEGRRRDLLGNNAKPISATGADAYAR